MTVCPGCFSDKEVKGFILSSGKPGKCGVCGGEDINVLEVEEFLDFFQELVDNYQLDTEGEPLKSKIQANWSFFASHEVASKILNEVLPHLNTDITNSEERVNYTSDIIENYSHWEVLKNELKWSRRFLTNIERLEDLGWDGFFNTQFELKPNDLLYRARVHHKSGRAPYSGDDMRCPDPAIVGGGRANPLGIPFLYLSDNEETVLYEVRASFLDELSVATFHLKKEIGSVKIVDFTEDTALFQPTRLKETIKARLLREKISRDLSKPMRRYDSEIEYIPTQFICEYIKVYTGADGIRFRSSLHPAGNNLVIFDQDRMECQDVVLRRINKLNLKAIGIGQ